MQQPAPQAAPVAEQAVHCWLAHCPLQQSENAWHAAPPILHAPPVLELELDVVVVPELDVVVVPELDVVVAPELDVVVAPELDVVVAPPPVPPDALLVDEGPVWVPEVVVLEPGPDPPVLKATCDEPQALAVDATTNKPRTMLPRRFTCTSERAYLHSSGAGKRRSGSTAPSGDEAPYPAPQGMKQRSDVKNTSCSPSRSSRNRMPSAPAAPNAVAGKMLSCGAFVMRVSGPSGVRSGWMVRV